MREQSAREAIAQQLDRRQAQYLPWFSVDTAPIADVRSLAAEMSWEVPAREDDETEDDYTERCDDDARRYVEEQRDDENAVEDTVLGFGLSVSVTARIDLSTGGPGDYLTCELDTEDNMRLTSVTYHYVPWFDHAETEVREGSPLWDLAERFCGVYYGMSPADVTSSDS